MTYPVGCDVRPSKPKGLPRLGEKMELVRGGGDGDDLGAGCSISGVSTPYRLPRLLDADVSADLPRQSNEPTEQQVWTRHGYDVISR